jgi:hypothetical protein
MIKVKVKIMIKVKIMVEIPIPVLIYIIWDRSVTASATDSANFLNSMTWFTVLYPFHAWVVSEGPQRNIFIKGSMSFSQEAVESCGTTFLFKRQDLMQRCCPGDAVVLSL